MNDIAQLIGTYLEYDEFYKIYQTFNLNERLYWKHKTLPHILEAIKSGHYELTKYLIKLNPIKKTDNIKSFMFMFSDRTNVVSYADILRKTRFSVSGCLIEVACYYEHLDIVKLLYENGYPIGDNAILHACNKGNIEILKFLKNIN